MCTAESSNAIQTATGAIVPKTESVTARQNPRVVDLEFELGGESKLRLTRCKRGWINDLDGFLFDPPPSTIWGRDDWEEEREDAGDEKLGVNELGGSHEPRHEPHRQWLTLPTEATKRRN